jgi:hypothetical protein
VRTVEEAAFPSPAAAGPPASNGARLAALNQRLSVLIAECAAARAHRAAAHERFHRLCPARPRKLIAPPAVNPSRQRYFVLEFNISRAPHNRGPHSFNRLVLTPAVLADELAQRGVPNAERRWLRERLRIAEAFERAAEQAAEQAEIPGADAQNEAAIEALKRLGAAIFDIEPTTLAEIQIHARAIVAIAEQGFDSTWPYHGKAAPGVMAALLRLSAGA